MNKTNWYSGAGDNGGVGIVRSKAKSSCEGGEGEYKPFSSLIVVSLYFLAPKKSLHLII